MLAHFFQPNLDLEATRASATTSALELATLGLDEGFLQHGLVLLNDCKSKYGVPCACGDRSRSA